MAALRDIARDFATEIRDGIGWTIVYRTGRSWNARRPGPVSYTHLTLPTIA